jgi:O-antigen/teichoic acid export membrane protein
MDWIARSQVVKGTLSLAALAGVFYLTRSTLYASLAMAGAFAVTLLAFDLPMGARLLRNRSLLRPRWHLSTLKTLLVLAIPLGIAVAANSLGVNIPRYFLASAGGERALGIFGAIASPLMAGVLIVNALGQSASPRLAKYYAAGQSAAFDSALKKLVFLGALLGAAAVAVALGAGRPILAVLFRPEYAVHADVFVWLVVAAALQYNYIFMGTAINAMRAFRIQAPLNLVTPLGALVFCGLWVPRYGLRGAGWAMVATAGFEALAHLMVFAYLRRRPPVAAAAR